MATEARQGARCREGSAELTCVSVTLVGIVTSLTSEGQPAELVRYCRDTLAVLFQDLDLMTQLVHHFQTEDQIISHLAAKSVSTYVVHHLLESATVSPVWQQKCVQAFHSSSPGQELDGCLWSLTDVLKRLLQAAHQEILGKIVAAFEPSLGALCSKFLPEEKQRGMDFTSCDRWGTTFCLLLDLLEALAASSVICGAGLKSPRLVHIHSSALLTTISCSPEYFVKKRALLLLKRAVLQKAGEDWASGEVLSAGRRHEHFSTDMIKLAQTVLAAVAADWLQSVQVESASFFGGNKHSDGGQKPDCVMLRAVSLLILKSTELHIQAPGITGVDSAPDVYGYLQSLWGFLRQCSVHLMEVKHLCSWVSLLFGEQDDDMMEAAKASLFIFLHHRLCSGLDDIAESEAACVSGCNPHCHFLFLLQSVSFDHSILLDFLISSETCFLEYFVRYLKYLKADWQGFTAACERVTKSRCHVSLQESFTFSCAGDMPALTYTGEPDQVEFSSCVQPSGFIPPADRISLVAGLPLVEYDSSDESDAGSMEISEDEPGPSVCEKSKCPAFYVKQKTFEARQKQHESSDSAGLLSEPTSTVKRRPDGLSLPMLQSKQRLCTHMAPLSGQGAGMFDTLYEWFWWDRIWLPVNLTWADLVDKEGRVYAKASDLYVTVPYAFVFLLIRYLFESWIATPLALSAGIRQRVHLKAQDNPILELYYTTQCRSPAQADIDGLSKKSYLSVRQVERWFRRRRNQDCPGVLKKFREACWRFVFYLLAFIGGIAALYDKEWFYDTREVWTGFPKQSMLESQYWYYVLEMSFYGSLLFSMSFDVKRKDFKEQIIHHLATLVLLSFSWCSNYIRVGTLVMLVHDASDVLLESAKLFNYAKWEKACNTLFVLFAIVFMVTRLIIFPFWLIHCTWVYPIHHYPAFFGYYFFNVMLMVLLCLHIFWAYLILCMIRKFMFSKMTRDERSENEEEEEEESNATEDEAAEEHKLGNGHAVHEKEDKNGCFGCLSPREDICRSKTVY
ncbi:putative protein Lines -like [Scophthalmus maximus]|uniref:Ceramide synthase 2-like n=2 Tax=Scophthalmus maximus TaxID=52904 RepID=A0A2U9BDR6_SCOMX|nr:putative protein Lines -like [Scophthalmus maximus]